MQRGEIHSNYAWRAFLRWCRVAVDAYPSHTHTQSGIHSSSWEVCRSQGSSSVPCWEAKRMKRLNRSSKKRLLKQPKIFCKLIFFCPPGRDEGWTFILPYRRFLLFHIGAAAQFEEKKNTVESEDRHFYCMSMPRQVFPY